MRLFAFAFAIPLLGQTARVPFVGCDADGQAGPVEAPKGADMEIPVQASIAQRLAYYKVFGLTVLGPRGWHCFGLHGSSGAVLFVKLDDLSYSFRLSGPVIRVDSASGGGSGSYEVARVVARVFPTFKSLPQALIREGLGDGIAFGPYPRDQLTVQKRRLVEFRTPPHAEGLGTMEQLEPSDDPIDGVAILQGSTPDLLMLRVRLPRELRDLAPIIIHQFERVNAERK